MIDPWDPEGTSAWLYDLAGADLSSPPGMLALARGVLGRDAVELVPARAVRRDAALVRLDSEWRIYVRRGLAPERATWAIAHELAEWAYRDEQDEYLEQACDALAGAIVAPRPAYVRLVSGYARLRAAFTAAAEAFVTTPSCAALRLGEATGRPVALVAPGCVRVRGSEFGWPPAEVLRSGAVGPGVSKVATGERGRVALVAG